MQTQTAATGTAEPPADTYVSSLPGILGVIDSTIARVEAVLLASGVLLMAANTIANVVGRFVFQSSLFFTEEVNRILIILITFAGISYAARQGRHIRMSAIYDELTPHLRKALMILISVVTAVFMFGLAWYSLQYILTLQSHGKVLPSLGIKQWIIYVWAPIGFLMTGLQYALTAIKNVMEKDIYLSTNVLDGYESDEFEV
nr:TRAP transporter small permease [Tropicimonas sp. IMCC34043]